MAARGYRKLGVIGCRGASWSEPVDGEELRAEDSRFLNAVSLVKLILFYLLHCGMLISERCVSSVVPL